MKSYILSGGILFSVILCGCEITKSAVTQYQTPHQSSQGIEAGPTGSDTNGSQTPAPIQTRPPVPPIASQAVLPAGPDGSVRTMVLHHSTGGYLLGGGSSASNGPRALYPKTVGTWLQENNHARNHSPDYTISEMWYPRASALGNNPIDYWNLWINPTPASRYGVTPPEFTLEEFVRQGYGVISLKHCYPVSDVVANSGVASIASTSSQDQNYRLQYEALKVKLRAMSALNPNVRFIVWTGAARKQVNTPPSATELANAQRARLFFEWVKNVWDEKGDNIYIFDFWTIETGGGETDYFLKPENASADSHPNAEFNRRAAPYFASRLVDVIEGRGDTGALTGYSDGPLGSLPLVP